MARSSEAAVWLPGVPGAAAERCRAVFVPRAGFGAIALDTHPVTDGAVSVAGARARAHGAVQEVRAEGDSAGLEGLIAAVRQASRAGNAGEGVLADGRVSAYPRREDVGTYVWIDAPSVTVNGKTAVTCGHELRMTHGTGP